MKRSSVRRDDIKKEFSKDKIVIFISAEQLYEHLQNNDFNDEAFELVNNYLFNFDKIENYEKYKMLSNMVINTVYITLEFEDLEKAENKLREFDTMEIREIFYASLWVNGEFRAENT